LSANGLAWGWWRRFRPVLKTFAFIHIDGNSPWRVTTNTPNGVPAAPDRISCKLRMTFGMQKKYTFASPRFGVAKKNVPPRQDVFHAASVAETQY
jgi:hypothetical protein